MLYVKIAKKKKFKFMYINSTTKILVYTFKGKAKFNKKNGQIKVVEVQPLYLCIMKLTIPVHFA